jgi:hypothetical protein
MLIRVDQGEVLRTVSRWMSGFFLKKTSECVVKLLMAKELSTIKFNVACENAFVIQSRGSFIYLLT